MRILEQLLAARKEAKKAGVKSYRRGVVLRLQGDGPAAIDDYLFKTYELELPSGTIQLNLRRFLTVLQSARRITIHYEVVWSNPPGRVLITGGNPLTKFQVNLPVNYWGVDYE